MQNLIEPVRRLAEQIAAQLKELQESQEFPVDDPGAVAAFVGQIPLFLDFGRQAEVYSLCEEILDQLDSREQESIPPVRHSHAHLRLFCQVQIAHMDCLRKKRLDEHGRLYALLLAGTDGHWQAHGHFGAGALSLFEGELETALLHFSQAHRLFTTAHDTLYALKALIRKISILRLLERYDDADNACRKGISLACAKGARAAAALVYAHALLGSSAAERDDLRTALRVLKESARLAKAMPPCMASSFAMLQYGNVLARLGRHEEALPWLLTAEKIQRIQDPVGRAATLFKLARSFRALHRWPEARAHIELALAHRMTHLDPEDLRDVSSEALEIFLGCHDPEAACQLVERVRERGNTELPAEFQERIAAWHQEWHPLAAAPALPGREFFIDREARTLAVKTETSPLREHAFRSHGATWQCLAFLVTQWQTGRTSIPASELIHVLAGADAKHKSHVQRLRRALQPLLNQGLITLAPEGQVCIAEGGAVHGRGFFTAPAPGAASDPLLPTSGHGTGNPVSLHPSPR